MNTRDAFLKNLPNCIITIRGNATHDATNTVSKAGNTFASFKIAHSFGKDLPATFFRVMHQDGPINVRKGDYVQVCGDYKESTYTDESSGVSHLLRTIFATSVVILGHASENVSKAKK